MDVALKQVREPMFLLLISCASIYLFIGDTGEGIILFSTVTLMLAITFFQTRKTERALESLRRLAAPRALVIRDGVKTRVAAIELVTGDLLLLNEGDRVPADARLLESQNLAADESLITGESVPVNRAPGTGSEHLLAGSLIVRGRCLAEVTATGTSSAIGKIAASLKEVTVSGTPLQSELKVLIRKLGLAGVIICLSVILLFYITRHNFVQALLTGLSSAMAILPEEFPVVLTVFLALGAWRLSKRNVLARDPAVIETLGSTTVLCTDKTGTLTMNRMEIAQIFNGNKTVPNGSYYLHKDDLAAVVLAAVRATPGNRSADPMDNAVLETAGRVLSNGYHNLRLVMEYPLTSSFPAVANIWMNDAGDLTAYAKGAPEILIGLCTLSADERKEHLDTVKQLAEQGLRVLAVAQAKVSAPAPASPEKFAFSFLGLLGFRDPLRPEVPGAIAECHKAGIRVIMITGDFPVTAATIARDAGLPVAGLITGQQLQELSDEELKTKITTTNIFARVKPEQKLRIVRALQANIEIVAMTGDGVNDAPALRAADIGIAMGNKGTDVAREAASLVLLDDNFASIVNGIRMGRRIFDNLQKSMSYIMAVHIPIIGLTLLPAFLPMFPILLLPLHIVFMELIIDPVCSIAFESEEEEKGIMDRSPRDQTRRFFGLTQISSSVLHGLLLLGLVIAVFRLSANEGHTIGEARAIAFSTLILGNVFLIVHKLSRTRIFLHVFRNMAGMILIAAALLVLFLVISVPGLSAIFSFEFPGYAHFLPAATASAVLLLALEFQKIGKLAKRHPAQIGKRGH